VTSAYELRNDNPPQNIYSKPKRFQMLEEHKVLTSDTHKTTFRKILDGIEHEAIYGSPDKQRVSFNPGESTIKFKRSIVQMKSSNPYTTQ
jgi:hypothetical protein